MQQNCFLLAFLITISASESFAFESAKTLGRSEQRYALTGSISRQSGLKYNSNGRITEPTDLNRTISIGAIGIQEGKDLQDLVNSVNSIQENLGDGLYRADIYFKKVTEANRFDFEYAYGLSDSVEIGAKAFVVRKKVKAKLDVAYKNNAAAVSASLKRNITNPPQDLIGGLDKISSWDDKFIEDALLLDKGYQKVSDYSSTDFGYVEVDTKFEVFQTSRLAHSTKIGFRIPTASDPDIRNIQDEGYIDDLWATYIKLMLDFELSKNIKFYANVQSYYFFPTTKKMPVPRDRTDLFPSLLPEDQQVRDVKYKRASELFSEIAASVDLFGRRIQVWSAYQLRTKAYDSFEGDGNLFYDGLAHESELNEARAEFGLAFKPEFFGSAKISSFYSFDLSGKNFSRESIIGTEVGVIF